MAARKQATPVKAVETAAEAEVVAEEAEVVAAPKPRTSQRRKSAQAAPKPKVNSVSLVQPDEAAKEAVKEVVAPEEGDFSPPRQLIVKNVGGGPIVVGPKTLWPGDSAQFNWWAAKQAFDVHGPALEIREVE